MRREDLLLAATTANPGLDRAAHLRIDLPALANYPSKILEVSRGGVRTLNARLHLKNENPELAEVIFLGVDNEGTAYFARSAGDSASDSELTPLREVVSAFSPFERLLAAHAVALMNWHESHPHCPRCGSPTVMSSAGNARLCKKDERELYPRTDSAVIVLVKDRDDRILLGRQASWPEGRYSTFAGFVEPGESFESAVEREVREECGIVSEHINYLGSHPWPFPASIMVAFEAIAKDPSQALADGVEIERVEWFSRAQFREATESGRVVLPPSISIARRMIEGWYGEALTGGEAWR